METLVIILAKYFILIPVIVVGATVLWRLYKYRDWKFLAFVILGGILSLALAEVAGMVISHPQPFVTGGFEPLIPHEPDNSFPSDHVLLAAFLAYAMFLKNRVVAVVLFIVAILIGWARVRAGVHYPVDVLASIGFSLLGVAISWIVVDLSAKKFVKNRLAGRE